MDICTGLPKIFLPHISQFIKGTVPILVLQKVI